MRPSAAEDSIDSDDAQWQIAVEDLSRALADVGWKNRAEFAHESAALLRAMATPSRLHATHRFLAIERLGMQDRAVEWGMKLTADELLIVLARMSIIDRSRSYSAEELSSLLGWALSEVELAGREGSLYAYTAGTRLLFPEWQFDINLRAGSATVISEDLPALVALIPDSAVPGLVRAVMTLECPMIPKRSGRPVSARDHLSAGGSFRPVAAALLYFLDGSLNRFFAV
jgi:hypothetical protein